MKNITTTIILLLLGTSLAAQYNSAQDTIPYLTDEEKSARLHEPAKALFKTYPLGYERKISNTTSVAGQLFLNYKYNDALVHLGLKLGIELRHYFQMNRRVKAGQQAYNLSGQYFSLNGFAGYGPTFGRINTPQSNDSLQTKFGPTKGLSLNFGSQKRVGPKHYIDDYIKLEIFDSNTDKNDFGFTEISLSNHTNIALGLTRNRKEREIVPGTNIYLNRKFSLRIMRNNSFKLSRFSNSDYIADHWRLTLRPHLLTELKIAESSFSVFGEINTSFIFSDIEDDIKGSFGAESINYYVNVGTRYYYKMKKKIMRGEGGNDFTGPHFLASFYKRNNNSTGKTGNYLLVGYGYQQEIGDHFFYGYKFTLPIKLFQGTTSNVRNGRPIRTIELTVGYRIFDR